MTAPPRHIAVIMDGNGRWALSRGKPRLEGHRAGAKTLERLVEWCRDRGVRYLTVYAFSTENWCRPKDEVDGLMRLLATFLRTRASMFLRDRVRFRVVGRRSDLSPALLRSIEALERRTKDFEQELLVALSYGGRAEIVDAARSLMNEAAAGRLSADDLDEAAFAARLYAPDVPDPDLLIRTSGELRVSNFLLWQCAYAELYVTPVLWPDFSHDDFEAALSAYAARDRRRGGHA